MDEKTLCIAIGTCDKHSFLWKAWWHYFSQWEHDYPVYFLNEKKDVNFPVKQIKVDIPDVNIDVLGRRLEQLCNHLLCQPKSLIFEPHIKPHTSIFGLIQQEFSARHTGKVFAHCGTTPSSSMLAKKRLYAGTQFVAFFALPRVSR